MSFDATRAVWAARDAGDIRGGSQLFVALSMADRARRGTAELDAGTRGIAARLGISRSTVARALHELEMSGVVETVSRGIGTRPTRWRLTLVPPLDTASEHPVENNTQRPTDGTLENGLRPTIDPLRPAGGPIASLLETETRTRYVTSSDDACGELPPHLANGTPPDEIPDRVAVLRDALGGRLALAHPPLTVVPPYEGEPDW